MLRVLVWKDLRLVQLILLLSLGAFVAAVPLNIGLTFVVRPDVLSELSIRQVVAGSFEAATMFLPVVCYVSIILTAGSIIAGERQERTADFLAALPPLRTKVLLSKGIVVGSTIAAWILIYVGMLGLTMRLGEYSGAANHVSDLPPGYIVAQVFLGAGGIAWAASSFCRTITPPVLMGIIVPALFVAALQAILFKSNLALTPQQIGQWIIFAICTLGILGFATGTIIYLNRET